MFGLGLKVYVSKMGDQFFLCFIYIFMNMITCKIFETFAVWTDEKNSTCFIKHWFCSFISFRSFRVSAPRLDELSSKVINYSSSFTVIK